MEFLRRRLINTHNDQGGQTIIFVVIALFVLICFLALTINVGNRISKKVQAQNAADAAAMSGGIWIARGLNTMCILNVSMTECLALIILLEAVKKGNEFVPIIMGTSIAIYAVGCYFLGAGCDPAIRLARKLVQFPAYRISLNKKMEKVIKLMWTAMRGIRGMEEAVKLMGALGPLEARCIAKANGADVSMVEPVLYPPMISLPVTNGDFYDLCAPTSEKRKPEYHYSGYKRFLCWDGGAMSMKIDGPFGLYVKIKWLFSLAWWIPVNGMAPEAIYPPLIPPFATTLLYNLYLTDAAYDSMCKKGDGAVPISLSGLGGESFTAQNCDECEREKGSPVVFEGKRIEIDSSKKHVEDGEVIPLGKKSYRSFPSMPGFKKQSGYGGCKFTKYVEEKRPEKDEVTGETVVDDKGNTIYENVPFEEIWGMIKCPITMKGDIKIEKDTDVAPYILDQDWLARPDFLAAVRKKSKDKLSFTSPFLNKDDKDIVFKGPGEKTSWSVAAVRVYNPTGEDLFNQDWKVKLVPVDPKNVNWTAFGVNFSEIFATMGVEWIIDEATEAVILH